MGSLNQSFPEFPRPGSLWKFRCSQKLRDRKAHKLFDPHPRNPFGAPREKLMFLISWEGRKKGTRINFGGFGGQKGGPRWAATKGLTFCCLAPRNDEFDFNLRIFSCGGTPHNKVSTPLPTNMYEQVACSLFTCSVPDLHPHKLLTSSEMNGLEKSKHLCCFFLFPGLLGESWFLRETQRGSAGGGRTPSAPPHCHRVLKNLAPVLKKPPPPPSEEATHLLFPLPNKPS